MTKATDAAGYVNDMAYNGNGDMLEASDGNGNQYKFTYDSKVVLEK